MSERWWFRYEGGDEGSRSPDFPSQAEAEAWFAEDWQTVADAGVGAVTLMNEDVEVYGPMPLDAG